MRNLTQEERKALAAAQARVRELLDPIKEAQRIKAAKLKRERNRAAGKRAPEQRQPRELDAGYLAFLRRLPCVAGVMGHGDCQGATQAAHLRFSDASRDRRNPGLGNKPHDRHATPLCAHHHLRDQHARQEQAFWNGLGVDPGDLSAALYAAYQAGEDGLAVLRRFAPARERSA